MESSSLDEIELFGSIVISREIRFDSQSKNQVEVELNT